MEGDDAGMSNDSEPLLKFLSSTDEHYFSDSQKIRLQDYGNGPIAGKDIVLYRIDEITFEDDAPRKEALENVLSTVRIPGVNFIYLIVGDKKGVKFYYGLSKNMQEITENKLSLKEIGDNILKASICGNFRGCKVHSVTPEEKTPLLKKIQEMDFVSRIEGVAGTIKDNEEFQSVDRLVDVMQGEEFCVLLIAKALQPKNTIELENTLQEAYTQLSPFAKYNLQEGESKGTSVSKNTTKGESESSTKGSSNSSGINSSTASGTSTNESISTTKGSNTSSGGSSSSSGSSQSKSTTKGGGQSSTKTEGTSKNSTVSSNETKGKTYSISDQKGSNTGSSTTYSREYMNKCTSDWIKYCDDVVLPRLDYGKGKGTFLTALYVLSKKRTALIKLENTAIALYSGKQGNRVPLRAFPIGDVELNSIGKYQLPLGKFTSRLDDEEIMARAILSQTVHPSKPFNLCNWMTTNELSMLAGLPQKEIIGMSLREEVEFGLNYQEPDVDKQIYLGNMVQNGNEIESTPVYMDKSVLDKHVFIAGVTGSGKTTTCHKILLQSKLPFLVIEPAKTEYRILSNNPNCKDLLVFTLGNDCVAPFRLNPFEFLPHENITSHVDMIKASIEAAFDMEAAIPQLIETILYRCYEKCGWDISTNRNSKWDNPFDENTVGAFPTLDDMMDNIEKVVNEQKFDERLKNDYIGSIRARLQSLTIGAKGLMLNTKRSIDFDDLLDKKVVLELENIKNGSEKALIMGFVLSAFNEAVKARYLKQRKAHSHIILVEEAHRLLSKFIPGDSLNKKQGVEAFGDMLAEIRKYGESLIIVDQIPNKLSPDVLKNTNTKIIHRIFAQDDKEAVGNTMALKQEQKDFLSNLSIGRAVMFSDNFGEALQLQIIPDTSTTQAPLLDDELMDRAFKYYISQCKRPIMLKPRVQISSLKQNLKMTLLEFVRTNVSEKIVTKYKKGTNNKDKYDKGYADLLRTVLQSEVLTVDDILTWLEQTNVIVADGETRPRFKQWLLAYAESYEKMINVKMRDIMG